MSDIGARSWRKTAITTLKNYWKSIPPLWVPKRITKSNLPTKLLVALADLASHGAFNQMRLRAHQTIDHLFGKKNSDEYQVSNRPTLDGLVPFAVKAKQKFTQLWTTEASTGLTGFKFVPEPHAVEHFGAWPQRDLHDQAFADTIVSEAHQNALNDRGSASGDVEYGPTISKKTIVGRMRDWKNYSRPAGELWRAPKDPAETLIGYGAGARPIREKRDCFFRLELCFGATMVEIMLMEELRPEDAYFIPATLLTELDKLVARFPDINLATLHYYLREAIKGKRHTKDDRQYYNLSQKDLQTVIDILRTLQAEDKPINFGEEKLSPDLERELFGPPQRAYRHLKAKAPPVTYPGPQNGQREASKALPSKRLSNSSAKNSLGGSVGKTTEQSSNAAGKGVAKKEDVQRKRRIESDIRQIKAETKNLPEVRVDCQQPRRGRQNQSTSF